MNNRKIKFDKPEHLARLIQKVQSTFYDYFPIESADICWITPLCNSTPKKMPRALVRIDFRVADNIVEHRKSVKEAQAGLRKWADVVPYDKNHTHHVLFGADEFGNVFAEDSTHKNRNYDISTVHGAKWYGA